MATSTINMTPLSVGVVRSSTDFDAVTTSGFYYSAGGKANPTETSKASVWGWLLVLYTPITGEMRQVFTFNNGNNIYTRYFKNNAWSSWRTI